MKTRNLIMTVACLCLAQPQTTPDADRSGEVGPTAELTASVRPLGGPLAAQAAEQKLLVLDVVAQGQLSSDEAERIGQSIDAALRDQSSIDVLLRSAVRPQLRSLGLTPGSPCESESCLLQLRHTLQADYALSSRVSKLNGSYHLALQIFDTRNGKVASEMYLDYDSALADLLKYQIPLLVGRLLAEPWAEVPTVPGVQVKPPSIRLPERPEPSAPPASSGPPSSPRSASTWDWEQFWQVSRPIRVQRPTSISLLGAAVWGEAGLAPQLQGSLMYHLGPYLALGFSGGMGSVAEARRDATDLVSLETVNLASFAPRVRAYLNPHDLAVFADLSYSLLLREADANPLLHQFIRPQLGLEYRHSSGLNASLSGGLRLSVDNRYAPAFLVETQLGFAF